MRAVIDWAGRVMLSLGALMLLFVGYQLWGTNLVQAREQSALRSEFEEQLEASAQVVERPRAVAAATPSTTVTTAGSVTTLLPAVGEPVGVIQIPAIGVDEALVEGTDRDELRKGPGHYPHSPLPGHAGNVAIAGHRTTYGAPFYDLDQLEPGNEITVTTVDGTFTYVVREQLITTPDDVSVVDVTTDNRLTLTTCNPKYSARERLIVVADLQGDPIAPPEPPAAPEETPRSLPSEDVPDQPAPIAAPAQLDGSANSGVDAVDLGTLLWTGGAVLVAAAWWLAYRWRRGWATRLGGILPFLFVLFFFFGQVEELLPANY